MWFRFFFVVTAVAGPVFAAPSIYAAPEPSSEALTNVAGVRSLSIDDARRQLPVVVHGAVTYYEGAVNLLFLQDGTGGISVQCDRLVAPGLRRGRFVQVRGRTVGDTPSPVIRADSVVVLSNAPTMPSKAISLDQIASGQEDGNWVSITGLVRALSVMPQQRRLTMEISDGKETIRAHIPGFAASNVPPAYLYHTQVRVHGVAQTRTGAVTTGIFGSKRRWVGDHLFVPSLKEVTVIRHTPINVATTFIQPIKNLRELRSPDDALHVIKVAGVVTLALDKHRFYMQDASGGLLVENVAAPEAQPGQRVETIGFPDLTGFSPSLRQAQITHVSEAAPVVPRKTTVREAAQGRWDGELLTLEAEVVASVPRKSPQHFLLLRNDDILFQAQSETLHSLSKTDWLRPGSRVQLTGVCQMEPEENLAPPQGLILRLRSDEDVVLLSRPPWWTVRRVLAALGSAMIVVLIWLLLSFRAEARLKEKYRRLFENASDLVGTLNPEGKFTALNKAGRNILGLKQPKELPANLEQLIPAEERARFLQWWAEVVARHEPAPQEFTVCTAHDHRFVLEFSGQLWQSGGRPIEVICIGRDVTGRKQAEEKRLALERKMLDAQKLESLGVLAGGIAHDFNNMLTVILGNAALAQPLLPENSAVRSHLDHIQNTSLQAADLCKQMLAYSGKGRFLIQRINLNTVIHEMWPLLEMSVSKKASLDFNADPTLPDLEADPSQLRQIVMNLVINGSEALEDRPGAITIRTGRTRIDDPEALPPSVPEVPAGEFVVLEVTDTGCGMTPENQAKIFDPFFTTKFVGRGLGLAAVLGVVRAHSGTLQIQSEPGRGSTFRILLPLGKSADDATVLPAGPPTDGKRGTILLVDDDENVLRVSTQMLQASGYSVITAADGKEAVTRFRALATSITAVVLDLTMPQMGGEEAFEQIRLIKPDARVLLISGFSEPDPGPRWTTEDRWLFLQKPFKPADLADALEQLLGDVNPSPVTRPSALPTVGKRP